MNRLDGRQGEGLKIADELEAVYFPSMRAAIKENGECGAYEAGRNAGLSSVFMHLTKSEPEDIEALIATYTKAYDDFAGPIRFRHSVNVDMYHRAGLLGVYREYKELRSAFVENLEDGVIFKGGEI